MKKRQINFWLQIYPSSSLLRRHLHNAMFVGFAGALIFGAAAVFVPSNAWSQSGDLKPLLDRLERMERDIRTLNIQISRGVAPSGQSGKGTLGGSVQASGSGLARLEVRLSAFEEELSAVTGKMESESHQIDQMNKRLDKLVSDIDFRLSALEKSISRSSGSSSASRSGPPVMGKVPRAVPVERAAPGGAQPGRPVGTLGTLKQGDLAARTAGAASKQPVAQSKATGSAPQVASVLPKGSAKDQYAYAFGLLRQAKYRDAERALKAFIAKRSKHPLASNARYWLGEAYYVRAQFAEAAKIFYKAYQSNKKGNKAPDALLKLGMSLSGLKKQTQACAAFSKLIADYPSLQPSLKKKLAAERNRAQCR
jgi:tol-pal system protein YbgF